MRGEGHRERERQKDGEVRGHRERERQRMER